MNRSEKILGCAEAETHPSMAFIKYWGKQDSLKNLPATPSLALTLSGLTTRTRTELRVPQASNAPEDLVLIKGEKQSPERFAPFFREFRSLVRQEKPDFPPFEISVQSDSDYPAAAGLASSAAGFAALALSCSAAAGLDVPTKRLSALARLGSASAARSLWEGFTRLEVGSEAAEPLYPASWWPELRVLVLELEKGPKSTSSRSAMESVRETSPFYNAWVHDARAVIDQALKALAEKDLNRLGPLMRQSYMRMFATMMGAETPIIYWKPDSLKAMDLCRGMRDEGLSVWETMDAGPQVKIFCLENQLAAVTQNVQAVFPRLTPRTCTPGGAPSVRTL